MQPVIKTPPKPKTSGNPISYNFNPQLYLPHMTSLH